MEEMSALEKNETWEIFYLLPGKKTVENGYTQLNSSQVGRLRDIKQG